MAARVRVSHLVIPLFVVVSLILTQPLAAFFLSSIPSSHTLFDPALQAFILGWDWHALTKEPLRLFDAPIFHPEQRTLTYMDHLLGETAAAAPILWMTRSVAGAYNFLVLLSFVTSAWITYRLTRLLGVPRSGAWLCGFLFAFSPYRYANLDLLNQLQTQFLPLGLFFAVRYLQRWNLRDAVGIAATLVAQVYFGWYYAYYLGLALGLLLIYAIAGRRWRPPRHQVAPLTALAAGVVLAVLPVAVPYVLQRVEMPELTRTLGEAALYSADLLDYLRWSSSSVLGGYLPVPTGAQSYWPGFAAVGLAAVGTAAVLGRRLIRGFGGEGYFIVLGVATFILSLGPILQVGGHRIWIPLPYSLAHYVIPGLSGMRAPARLASIVLLAVVVLAGIGYRHLQMGWGRRDVRAWQGLVSVLFFSAFVCAWPRQTSMLELPTAEAMPPVYRWLAARPDDPPVLELPVPARDQDENEVHALRQYLILYHGKPRIGGISGFTSRRYREFRSAIQEFPDRAALDAAAQQGAKLIIVHYADYPEPFRGTLHRRVADQPSLTLRATFGDDVVYELQSNGLSGGFH